MKNINKNKLFRCFIGLTAWFLGASFLHSQMTNDLMKLKRVSDQYDERGFMKSKSVNVDGKLNIGNFNGNVSYAYSIAEGTTHGFPYNLSLSYCGSVGFTMLGNYAQATITSGTEDNWARLTFNKPVWIIGFNGFAVQALSAVKDYQCNLNPSNSTLINSHSLIDGYDYCNGLNSLEEGGPGQDRDEINLLRADGSILKLQNVEWAGDNESSEGCTGLYRERGVNVQGYAIIEFAFDEALKKKYWDHSVPFHSRGRRVRYYPGDGLEYIFLEELLPYGEGPLRPERDHYKASPTIFYLTSIGLGNYNLFNLEYYRHTKFNANADADTSLGRAPIKKIFIAQDTGLAARASYHGESATITFNFGLDAIIVQAFDKAFGLGLVSDKGALYYSTQPTGLNISSLSGTDISMVTKITDPEHRETTFSYDVDTTTFVNFAFPKNTTNYVVESHRRLKAISEASAQFQIEYYGVQSKTITRNSLINIGENVWETIFSNTNDIVKKVTKYKPYLSPSATTILSTDEYTYGHLADSATMVTGEEKTTIKTTDSVTRLVKTVETKYNRIQCGEVTKPFLHTYIVSEATDAGGFTQKSNKGYQWIVRPDTYDRWNKIAMQTSETLIVNNVVKSYRTFSYALDSISLLYDRDYKANLVGEDKFLVVSSRESKTLNPSNSNVVVFYDTVRYQYYPSRYDSLTLSVTGMWLPKTTFKSEDGVAPMNFGGGNTIASTNQFHFHGNIPALLGVETSSTTYAEDGTIVGGSRSYWTNTVPENILPLWHIQSDTLVGKGGARRMGNRYDYAWRLKKKTINPLGAFTTDDYSKGLAAYGNIFGKVYFNDSTSTDAAWNVLPWSYGIEAPFYSSSFVRYYTPSGDIETLRLSAKRRYGQLGTLESESDINGIISFFDYDNIGRLKTAYLPLDFSRQGSVSTTTTKHYDNYSSVTKKADGVTNYHEVWDTTYCDKSHRTNSVDIQDVNNIYVEKNMQPSADSCISWKERGIVRTLAEASTKISLSKVLANVANFDECKFQIKGDHIFGACVGVKIEFYDGSPSGIEKTVVYNCGVLFPDSDEKAGKKDETSDNPLSTPASDGWLSLSLPPHVLNNKQNAFILLTIISPGKVVFFNDADSTRPRLVFKGAEIEETSLNSDDFTLTYERDDRNNTATVISKIDDQSHSSNKVFGLFHNRYTSSTHRFGGDYHLLSSSTDIFSHGSTRRDSVTHSYSGLGLVLTSTDQEGNVVETQYDALGRPVKVINADNTYSTISYAVGSPASFGITDDYYGFCSAKTTTNERGVQYVQYTDAFDRLRREVADANGLALTTDYWYDVLGRLETVVNPASQTTRYWYDAFGRVSKKYQPDMGFLSYGYDPLGNVRFSQTQEQADSSRLSFHQYDDLNRLRIVGEAQFGSIPWDGHGDNPYSLGGRAGGGSHTIQSEIPPLPTRLTDQLDGSVLHDDGASAILTANKTLWQTPISATPTIDTATASVCSVDYLKRPANYYEPVRRTATLADFEHIARYPEFVRTVVAYDTLPPSEGAVWAGFPPAALWNQLTIWNSKAAVHGVRHQRGREAAVAYRGHGGEPFHYVVLSYDERGRVEALLRYTENLGFDAVYYQYNSMNAVTRITVCDPMRQYSTWYGYDHNGRVDSVWTKLSNNGLVSWHNGWNAPFDVKFQSPVLDWQKPDSADIVYDYNKRGLADTMRYPYINTFVKYAYNRRGFLNELISKRDTALVFSEVLQYDAGGQITAQTYKHGVRSQETQTYQYDSVNRLTGWFPPNSSAQFTYEYDKVGNRKSSTTMIGAELNFNRLMFDSSTGKTAHRYAYTADGALKAKNTTDSLGNLMTYETFAYNTAGLLWKYTSGTQDWRYRYSAGGEREQKRSYPDVSLTTNSLPLRWTYYLLGADKRQLAVYEGEEMPLHPCEQMALTPPPPTRSVYFQPSEYLTYGLSGTPLLSTKVADKEYRILDHLGNVRTVISQNIGIKAETDYEPFGKPLFATPERLTFIGKEKDKESDLGDFGVRKYDDDIGRFLSVDPLWEKFRSQTPYHYSYNNPIRLIDPSGQNAVALVKDQTITIKAVYIVSPAYTNKDIKEMQGINKTLNDANYKVQGGEYDGYSVKFDLEFLPQVMEDGGFRNQDNYSEGGYNIGNTITKRVNDPNYPVTIFEERKKISNSHGRTEFVTTIVAGRVDDDKDITMNTPYDTKYNRTHEIFHTFYYNDDNAKDGIHSYENPQPPNSRNIRAVVENPLLPKIKK